MPVTSGESIFIAKSWLEGFGASLERKDIPSLTSHLFPYGWFRDNLVFTWNHRSLCGESIAEYLSSNFDKVDISNVKLDDTWETNFSPERNILESAFTLETSIAYGRGLVMLQPDETGGWKALSVYMTMVDLKGHEEMGPESGYYDNHGKTWNEVFAERKERIESDPHVVIIGAAQSGLNVAARFRQMNIPALLLEQSDNVGDVWRNRYPSLTLHTPNTHHSLLYNRFPSNAPKFTPRDKVASMLEQYAYNQDLVVWNRSTLLPEPKYDPETRRWTVRILRDGKEVTLHPFHIVLAMGTLGKPFIPPLPGRDDFEGQTLHATDFKDPASYTGKNVVVIGAAQTASDICQDLATHGAASVTMVQRSSTVVASSEFVLKNVLDKLWPMFSDPGIGDFRSAGMPLGLLKRIMISTKDVRIAAQKDMIDGLTEAGLNVDEGPEGAGQPLLVFERLGGYWIDIGTAELIIQGQVKIKQGIPTAFTRDGITFRDGFSLAADAVIFATGYEPINNSISGIFGVEITKAITPVWGLDAEGELRRAYSPSGHPGLWWAIGDFFASRYYSKSLALQIKARELGLVKEELH